MAKSSRSIRGTTPQIEKAAIRLRHQLTPAETLLWQAIRGRRLAGLKFRCQHPIGLFIVDFYCPSQKLIIEVDGSIHNSQQDYDEARTEKLQSFSYRVIRFSNTEVLNNLDDVLARIQQFLETSFPPELGG